MLFARIVGSAFFAVPPTSLPACPMPKSNSVFRIALTLACLLSSFVVDHAWSADETNLAKVEFFETKIRPVLIEHCYQCHSSTSKSVKGDLLLDFRSAVLKGGESGPVVVPGKPEESSLIAALKYDGYEMPPKGKLPNSVVADFERWIRDGAVDPRTEDKVVTKRPEIDYDKAADFWAFKKPAKAGQQKKQSPLSWQITSTAKTPIKESTYVDRFTER